MRKLFYKFKANIFTSIENGIFTNMKLWEFIDEREKIFNFSAFIDILFVVCIFEKTYM